MTLQTDLEKYINSSAVLIHIYVDRMVLSSLTSTEKITEYAAFSHPRSLLGNYDIAEKTLTKLIAQSQFNPSNLRLLGANPIMFIQAMERTEAGLTFVELRALRELGFNSGARFVAIYDETGKLQSPDTLPNPINLKHFKLWKGLKLAFIALLTGFAIFTLFVK